MTFMATGPWRCIASGGPRRLLLGISLAFPAFLMACLAPALAIDAPVMPQSGPEDRALALTVESQPKAVRSINRPSNSMAPETAAILQQLAAMQAKMEHMQQAYNARLEQLQATITGLQAEVHKTSGEVPVAPAVLSMPPGDQDIGEALIFGEADMVPSGLSPSPSASVASSTGRSLAGGGLGLSGRSVLDPATQPFSNSGAALGQLFNPDMMVAGDFIGKYASRKNVADRSRISLRESEFGFSAAIDPYAKAAFIFAKPDGENLDLEEGYVTLLSLPYGLQAKVGQMRSPFGKMNVIHTHDLPQTDRPDAYVNFFGDEGLVESGVALSKILPTPWFSSLDVQVANGDTPSFFGHGRLNKPLVVSRWKNFFELSANKTLEVGLSGAAAPASQDAGGRFSKVGGLDLTYRWLPPNQYHAFIWQTEVLAAQRKNPALSSEYVFGGYSFMEYKLSNRWHAGARVDYTQYPDMPNAQSIAIAPYVDFWESEFGRWRAEYKHAFGDPQVRSSDQAWLQYTIIMGLHPPHTF